MLLEDNVSPEKQQYLQDELTKIVGLITKNNEITVRNNYKAIKLNEINASDFLNLSMWDFEYLSYHD